MIFMKTRIQKDLEEMEREPSQHRHLVQRSFLGADMGNHTAFVNFQLRLRSGPFEGCVININIKIGVDYPYTPPEVFCHDLGFVHPNMDLDSKQLMFSIVDPRHWKPTFELTQVICGVEMILLNPDLSYSSIRSITLFNQALKRGIFEEHLKSKMDLEYILGGTNSNIKEPGEIYSQLTNFIASNKVFKTMDIDQIKRGSTRVKIH